ncbi:dihydrofolate reductase [Cereibacter ovatus]|uniref:Dihydrofolate reductase n=1 Tax=Cereibacter ovatus TaxID=439529 RepID=A0A285D0H2_9RHOB|nr:dihydrofolate reductase [Cereibacter ovatus]SNX72796.1 dihydrofolate reductase [Cereibacter ovatus]
MLTVVVARAKGGAIGKGGTIPWHAPEDLAFFQRETLGGAVIMGRRTWESLPKRPLPRRMNIVVTSGAPEGEAVFCRFDAAIPAARAAGHARIYSIGGAGIFAAHLPLADRLLLTEVDLAVEGADTFFPDFDPAGWTCISRMELRRDGPACILHEYLRRR